MVSATVGGTEVKGYGSVRRNAEDILEIMSDEGMKARVPSGRFQQDNVMIHYPHA